jgi:hypothetical protein
MNWVLERYHTDIFPCHDLIYHRWISRPMMILQKVTLLNPIANPNAETPQRFKVRVGINFFPLLGWVGSISR